MFTQLMRPPKYTMQKMTELRRKMGSSIIIIANFNTPLLIMGIISRQRISNEWSSGPQPFWNEGLVS